MKLIRARKDHKCLECSRPILKGTEYERASGKFDGEVFADKTCMDCAHIRDGLSCGESVPAGTLWESINEVFGEITTGCLTKVETASAKAYLVERWQKWKGLHPPVATPRDTGATHE